MIARTGSKGFLAAHYDWLVLGVGIIVLGVGAVFYASSLGEDPDETAAEAEAPASKLAGTGEEAGKNGLVTDPLKDDPLTVTMTVTVHDFRSLEEEKSEEEGK